MASAASASLIEQKRDRAYVVVERWQVSRRYKGSPLLLTCVLHNTGRTPAMLAEYDLHVDLRKELPPLPDYRQLTRGDLRQMILGAGKEITLQAPTPVIQLSPELMRKVLDAPAFAALQLTPEKKEKVIETFASSSILPPDLIEKALDAGMLTLYFYGCFAYTDTFRGWHQVAFCTRYDPMQDILLVVREPGYNCST